jgi:hypothetical protein
MSEALDVAKLCNSYQERLHDNIDKLIDNFGGIIDAAKVKTIMFLLSKQISLRF